MQLQVAAFSIRTNLAYLAHEGLDTHTLYEMAQLTRDQLDESDRLVDAAVYERLLDYGSTALNYPDLGFRIGTWWDAGRWGLLGHIVHCCQSLAQALALQKRYQGLMGNVSRPEFIQGQKHSLLKWIPHYQCSHHLNEEALTSWVAFAKKSLGKKLAPNKVCFTHELKGDLQTYEAFFECPVIFNSEFNGIEFSNEILEMPFIGHNPELLKVLTSYGDLIVRKKQKNAANEVITQFIVENLQTKVPTLDETAQFLGVSPRNLQRKFKAQNTSFKAILDDVRKEYAYSYLLQTNYKISYVSQVLGFSEQCVFQRAFKRWTGITPGEYRNKHGVGH